MKSLLYLLLIMWVTPLHEKKIQSKARPANRDWIACLLVSTNGEKQWAEVKNKKDYSLEGSLLPGDRLLIKQSDGKEVKIEISSLAELLIPGKPDGYNDYYCLNNNPAYSGQYKLYRVLAKGECMLLYTQRWGKAGAMIINTSKLEETFSTANQRVADEYYIYYKNKLTPIQADDDLYLNPVSKNDCIQVFESCEKLVRKLKEKKTKPLKITEMVNMYNQCNRLP